MLTISNNQITKKSDIKKQVEHKISTTLTLPSKAVYNQSLTATDRYIS